MQARARYRVLTPSPGYLLTECEITREPSLPDGWLILSNRQVADGASRASIAERLRALTGAPPRITLPARAREVVTRLRWRFERGPIPPGLVAYTRWPWVVSNDRLVADGWRPTVTNEQEIGRAHV